MKNLKNLEYMSEVAKKDTKPIANVQYLNKKNCIPFSWCYVPKTVFLNGL